jgi:hypothetical protein
MRLLIVLSLLFVSACSYNPIIDTGGRSGTFSTDRAAQITKDKHICDLEIKRHVNFIENIWHWTWSVESETKYKKMMKTCMTARGHSVLF